MALAGGGEEPPPKKQNLAQPPTFANDPGPVQIPYSRQDPNLTGDPRINDVMTYIINTRQYFMEASEQPIQPELKELLMTNVNFVYNHKRPEFADQLEFKISDKLVRIIDKRTQLPYNPVGPDYNEYVETVKQIHTYCENEKIRAESTMRLQMLKENYVEYSKSKNTEEDDFQNRRMNIKPVVANNHLHAGASVDDKTLCEFITSKYENEGDKIVEPGKTLKDVFDELELFPPFTKERIGCRCRCCNCHSDFSKFNAHLQPFGSKRIKKIFLQYKNFFKGTYFRELLDIAIQRYEMRCEILEIRITISGNNPAEWDLLEEFLSTEYFDRNNNKKRLCDFKNTTWIVQIPRTYYIDNSKGYTVNNFEEKLGNIFLPMFDATQNPYSQLALLFSHITAFDVVDDESAMDKMLHEEVSETGIDEKNRPNFHNFAFFIYRNLATLNVLRVARGLKPFAFIPHCGESGSSHHLISGFLTGKGICHGLELMHNPVMQYAFYMSKVPITMSPMSNKFLFLPHNTPHPFGEFSRKGLCVTLSDDDPLIFHETINSLEEEYENAIQTFELTRSETNEAKFHSILLSGLSTERKRILHGENYGYYGSEINLEGLTGVPNNRFLYRKVRYYNELAYIFSIPPI